MLKIGSQVMYREGHKVKHKVEGIITYLKYENDKLSSVGIFLKNPKSTSSHDRFKFFYDDSKKLIVKGLPEENNIFSVGTLLNTIYGKAIVVHSDEQHVTLFMYKQPNSFNPLETLQLNRNFSIEEHKVDLYKSLFKEYLNLNKDKINTLIYNEDLHIQHKKNFENELEENLIDKLNQILEDQLSYNIEQENLTKHLEEELNSYSFESYLLDKLILIKKDSLDTYHKIKNDEEYQYNFLLNEFIEMQIEQSEEYDEDESCNYYFYNYFNNMIKNESTFSYKTDCLHLQKDLLVNYLVKDSQ